MFRGPRHVCRIDAAGTVRQRDQLTCTTALITPVSGFV